MKLLIVFNIFWLFAFSQHKKTTEVKLSVYVNEIESSEGQIVVRLFTEDIHMDPPSTYEQKVNLLNGKNKVVFNNIKKGEYSLFAWHDKNSNAKVDKNFLGIPSEKIGFSNNPVVRFRTPSFKSTKVVLDKEKEISIDLKKY